MAQQQQVKTGPFGEPDPDITGRARDVAARLVQRASMMRG